MSKKPSRKSNETKPAAYKPLDRMPTGVPRLDYILKGGFVRGGTYTVVGPPGSGKTIFANQTCFNQIRLEGASCLYVTLLAETHSKMISHLETLTFFDREVLGNQLRYLSGYSPLKQGGLEGLLSFLRKAIKDQKPTLLVIDGLHAAEKCAKEFRDFDEFLHQLQAYANITNCTTLLLTPSEGPQDQSQNVIVDGIIELSYQLIGPRAVRELTVLKFRGTNFLLGKHEVEITSDGVVIHPRTEVQFDQPPDTASEDRVRMPFGVKDLDVMLKGGLMSGTTTTLLGSPGTGKTMLGLSFLVEGARRGQSGIYFGFYEPPPRLIEKAERVGIPLRKYVDAGVIDLIWQPPLEHFMDSLAEQLLEKVKATAPDHKRRLFIDGIEGFRAAAIYPDRMPRFLSAFANQLRMADVTTLVSEELDLFKPEVHMPNPEVATVNEGVLLLRYVELNSGVHRLMSILKMRESEYDTTIREFFITNKGIVLGNPFSADGVLSGAAQVLAGHAPKRKRSERGGQK